MRTPPLDNAWSKVPLLLRFFPDSVQKTRIAVFPFVNNTGDKTITGGMWVAEYLVSRLKKTSRFIVVDRSDYRRTLRGNDIGPRDVIDDSTALRMAKALEAPYTLAGSIEASPSGQYKVAGRIYDTQTGIVVTGADYGATAGEFKGIEADLIAKRAKTIKTPAVLRSAILPGWGQFYRQRPVMGTVYSVGGLVALGAVAYFLREDLIAKDNQQTFIDTGYTAVSENRMSETERRNKEGDLTIIRNEKQRSAAYAGLVATGVWAVNILDVIAAGLQAEHEYRLYFSSKAPEQAEIGLAIAF